MIIQHILHDDDDDDDDVVRKYRGACFLTDNALSLMDK